MNPGPLASQTSALTRLRQTLYALERTRTFTAAKPQRSQHCVSTIPPLMLICVAGFEPATSPVRGERANQAALHTVIRPPPAAFQAVGIRPAATGIISSGRRKANLCGYWESNPDLRLPKSRCCHNTSPTFRGQDSIPVRAGSYPTALLELPPNGQCRDRTCDLSRVERAFSH